MKSSQRSESMNSFFDGYVNRKTPLSDFVDQYEKAIASCRDIEEKEDLISMTTNPDLTNMHSLEAHAGEVYSRNIFKLFQYEFMQILHCQHSKKVVTGGEMVYAVTFKDHNRSHTVQVNIFTQFCKCSCAKFETWGILCKHILYIMKQKLRLKIIPAEYILSRWTLNVRHTTSSTASGNNDGAPGLNIDFSTNEVTSLEAWTLRGDFNKLYEKIITRRDLYEVIEREIKMWWEKVGEIENKQMPPPVSVNVDDFSEANRTDKSPQEMMFNFTISDPSKCKTKGRPRNAHESLLECSNLRI